jgi:hypothetical protein
MNNNNTFLQLRQQTAEQVYKNGDYHSQLKKPIQLAEGDQLILNKAILDSASADSGNIVLEEDTNVGFYFNYYIVNYNTDEKYSDYSRATAHTSADTDSEQYVMCSRHNISGYEVLELNEIRYTLTGPIYRINPFTAIVKYREATTGDVKTIRISMIDKGGVAPGSNYYVNESPIGIRARKLAGEPVSVVFTDETPDEVLSSSGTSKGERTLNTTTISGADYEPVHQKVSVLMKAGNYSPSDFAERYTRLLTLQREGEFDVAKGTSNNPLLKSTSDFTTLTEPAFVRCNGGDRVIYYGGTSAGGSPASGNARWVGTNQFVLEYDVGTSRFKLSQTHFPIYSNSSGKMEVIYVANQGSATQFDLASAHSGIAFTAFFSEPLQPGKTDIRLWENILGFDTASLIVLPSEYITNPTLGVKVPNFGAEFQIAQQITTGNRGMDVGVKKTGNAEIVPNMAGATAVSTDITEVEPIFAGKDFETTNLTFGYYLIEIDGGITQDLITNTSVHTNIFSIISRYYQNNNYTTGNSADAVVYQHVGEPAYLNSLRVRVLNSSYNVPDDLGDDNTIFLQHVKASIPAEDPHENKVR